MARIRRCAAGWWRELPTRTSAPGLLWASLPLALLTVPVVIVATDEALAAVPRSMREGSLECGASKWQTICNIVLPRALPGIMTGLILAMVRGPVEETVTVYHPKPSPSDVALSVMAFNLWYGAKQALFDNTTDIQAGMVFQMPNPFPMSIYENVAYPMRIDGVRDRRVVDEVMERSLRSAALWDEAKDRLNESALGLSGGQQQRLCIARAIAGDPEALLMDEPCSALDPIATAKIEDLMDNLRGQYTIVIVTHSMSQAGRVSDNTAFMYLGRVIEYGMTSDIFTIPRVRRTQDCVTGRFG